MYPTIHDFSATDLATQGHGALSDCISCEVTEELNGEFTLELKYPLNGLHSEYMIPGNIIMVVPSHNQIKQPFRISKIKRSFANNMTVYANHICYDLSGYPAKASVTYSSLSAVISAMNAMTWNTGTSAYNQFSFATDKSSNATFKMEGAQTLRAWMGGKEGSILDTYGGEWSYDGFSCYLASRRGVDTGYRISYGKNLAEYEKEKDFTEYSHICAYWKKSETLVSGNLVSTGLSCPFRCAYYDASNDFENQPTVVQLDSAASAQISGLDIGAQTITITPSQLGNDVIGLGDSVLVCYETIFRTRVVKTVWDSLVGKYIKIQLGSKKTNISDTIKSLTEGPSGETEAGVQPADYVVTQSVSATSGYTKWNSGKMECWKRVTGTVNATTAWGSLYYGTISSQSFPASFLTGNVPTVILTIQSKDGGLWINPNNNPSVSATGTIYVTRPGSLSSISYILNIYAVGKWK